MYREKIPENPMERRAWLKEQAALAQKKIDERITRAKARAKPRLTSLFD